MRPILCVIVYLLALIASFPPARAACPPPVAPLYQGPLFDAMAQIESTQSPTLVLDVMRAANVDKMALFARLHRRRNGESNVLQAGQISPQHIVMGAPKSFDEQHDLGATFVTRLMEDVAKYNYAFVGEIMFTHGDKTHGEQTESGERYVDPLAPGVQRLIEGLKVRPIPVMTHWEVYDWDRDWPRISKLYSRFSEQTFIWPHTGFAHARQVEVVLSRHPNVVATLSKKEQDQRELSNNEKGAQLGPALIDACGIIRPVWRELLVRYQDRLMFATDAHKDFRWQKYGNVIVIWRGILGQLPPPVAEKIAYSNAARIYAARQLSN